MTLEDLARELPRLQAEAKALWGESKTLNLEETKAAGYKGGLGAGIQTIGWKQHLQAMVIAENPLDYLKEKI